MHLSTRRLCGRCRDIGRLCWWSGEVPGCTPVLWGVPSEGRPDRSERSSGTVQLVYEFIIFNFQIIPLVLRWLVTFFIQTSPDVCFHLSFVAPGHGLQDMLLPSFWLEAFFSFSNVFPQEFTVNFPVALVEWIVKKELQLAQLVEEKYFSAAPQGGNIRSDLRMQRKITVGQVVYFFHQTN